MFVFIAVKATLPAGSEAKIFPLIQSPRDALFPKAGEFPVFGCHASIRHTSTPRYN